MNQPMWVSEWRITPNTEEGEFSNEYPYKVSDGVVYTIARNLVDAKVIMDRNIMEEMQGYIINNLACPNCGIRFAEHEGRYDKCLISLALHQSTGRRL